jgi:Fe2+ or Zn2+ uptake regulation protein
MEPSALQYVILRLLELHEAEGGATDVHDVDIAAVTHAALREVHRQLEILQQRHLVELMTSGSSYAVRLTYHRPRLRLLAGRLWCFHAIRRPTETAVTHFDERAVSRRDVRDEMPQRP